MRGKRIFTYCNVLQPDREHERDGYQDSVCPSLPLLLGLVRHPALLQEDEDLAVDYGDDHQGENELEHAREDCVPEHQK